MGIGFKIRALLLLLGICCIVTALSINQSLNEAKLIDHEAGILQDNLAQKEQEIANFLKDKNRVSQARQFHQNSTNALRFISNYRDNGINILTYEKENLSFWSSIRAFPKNITSVKEGSSFIPLENGFYEVIKKTYGEFTILFMITIKNQYTIENQYLSNQRIR
ncbi:MAG: hypothetical protein EOO89_23660 [Pedobacter sp.]|nr:MAG: hypothetical protein EOO89_23660 [Pedobacter sp.]